MRSKVLKVITCINRNILECKCEIVGVHLTGFDDVLIETYWNVKAAEEVSEPIRLKY